MPEDAPKRPDRVTLWFLIAILAAGVLYVAFDLTPSSYGVLLTSLGAPEAGPVVGTPRGIRSDEWAIWTPLFQIAVRNGFQRINETSIYHEDLRNFIALPLKDWSLIFKPQLWAFFALPPATALSIYFAILMCAFLAGFYFLFLELGTRSWLAAAAALIVYFSGFTQFWWTTYGPLMAIFPWVLLLVLRPMPWWTKALIGAWFFPAFALSHLYPPLLLTMAWCGAIVVLAFRPRLLRSPSEIATVAIGLVIGVLVAYFYFSDMVEIMRHTVYPGRRITQAGQTPLLVALSEIFPFAAFQLSNYQHIVGQNICETGVVGSFLPLATLCLMRYKALREDRGAWFPLIVLLTGFTFITLWTVAPAPAWIGQILFWNRILTNRWLFILGLLLTLASLKIWNRQLISVTPLRVAIFVLVGPVAGLALKIAYLIHRGIPVAETVSWELYICGAAICACSVAWFAPETATQVIVITVVFLNVYGFGRFNPLQPADPIFQVPETDSVQALRRQAAAAPGGVLVESDSWGGTLNGLGLRSVNHILLAPRLDFFRQYFPAMDTDRFDWVFNRYSRIRALPTPLPQSPMEDEIDVPMEVFLPVKDVRRVILEQGSAGPCAAQSTGAVERMASQGSTLVIEGWAPWRSETGDQGIRIVTNRTILASQLSTVTRPDVAEKMGDYGYVKAGFRLKLSGEPPIKPVELAISATATELGETPVFCLPKPKNQF